MNELLGSPLSRILVNSAMTCMTVASTFVEPLPNAVSDTSLLLSMADSDMSVQPCSSSTSLSKPPLTTEVQMIPATNPSIPLGSPKGQYANLGQGIRVTD